MRDVARAQRSKLRPASDAVNFTVLACGLPYSDIFSSDTFIRRRAKAALGLSSASSSETSSEDSDSDWDDDHDYDADVEDNIEPSATMSWAGFKKNVNRATTQVMMKTGRWNEAREIRASR